MNRFDYSLPVLGQEVVYFDNLQIISLLSANYDEAVHMLQVGKVSQHAFNWFTHFWHFCSWRFSSQKQERYSKCLGVELLKKRFLRTAVLRNRLLYLLRTNQIKGL